MKKNVLTLLITLSLATLTFAEPAFRTGLQLGTNMESADGYAFEIGAHADALVFPDTGILIGMQMDFTMNSSSWSSNPSMYIEWLTPLKFGVCRPFVKGNLGLYVYHDDNKKNNKSGSLTSIGIGSNIDLGKRFYLSPAVTFGYPFMWEAGLGMGFKFGSKGSACENVKAEAAEEKTESLNDGAAISEIEITE